MPASNDDLQIPSADIASTASQEKAEQDGTTVQSYCRCLWHGALPYGKATLTKMQLKNVQYQAGKKANINELLPNGFFELIFTLNDNNEVTAIHEAIYDTSNNLPQQSFQIFGL